MKKGHQLYLPMVFLPIGIASLTLLNAIILVLNIHLSRKKRRYGSSFPQKDDGNGNDDSVYHETGLTDYINLLENADISSRINIMDPGYIYPTLERRMNRETEFMSRLDTILDANLTDPAYSVNRLCSDINMERSGVYKIVHRVTGLSTSDYISSRRVAYAIRKIGDNPDLTDSEVAEISGFCSAKSLQMQLIKHTGRSTYDCRLMARKNKC